MEQFYLTHHPCFWTLRRRKFVAPIPMLLPMSIWILSLLFWQKLVSLAYLRLLHHILRYKRIYVAVGIKYFIYTPTLSLFSLCKWLLSSQVHLNDRIPLSVAIILRWMLFLSFGFVSDASLSAICSRGSAWHLVRHQKMMFLLKTILQCNLFCCFTMTAFSFEYQYIFVVHNKVNSIAARMEGCIIRHPMRIHKNSYV